MTVGEFLENAGAQLRAAGIESAHLDAVILLEDALHRDRASLLAHPETEIDTPTEVALNNKVAQRALHIPLAYIRGKAEFYSRVFQVTPDVLVPRPETEAMIELLKDLQFGLPSAIVPLRIADVGTGSGCLGITAALELREAHADLYDVDAAALGMAAHNAKLHKIKIGPYHEDLLTHAKHRRYDIILANLPYVPLGHKVNDAAKHEPKIALFAGDDGLDAYRRLWKQIAGLEWQPAHVFTESLATQHRALADLAKEAGYHLARTKGLVQEFTKAQD